MIEKEKKEKETALTLICEKCGIPINFVPAANKSFCCSSCKSFFFRYDQEKKTIIPQALEGKGGINNE